MLLSTSLILFGWVTLSCAAPNKINVSQSGTLVVGGEEARKGEFPWLVGIRRPTHMCGASIINSEWVLTAAHCSQGDPSTYTLVAGDHHNNEDEGTEQRRSIRQIVNHPNHSAGTNENDISLIQVTPPFEFNEFVQPLSLAGSDFILSPHDVLTLAGWGMLFEDGKYPTSLMKVDLPFVNDEQCRVFYGANRIKDNMLCAGEEGKDGCKADSGSPLLCPEGDHKVVCGVSAFGTGCARPDKPGVYMEVSYYQDWIQSVLNESQNSV